MKRPGARVAWTLGNAVALVAFALLASHWWMDGDLDRVGQARGLAAYLNAASALPILLLSQVGRLLILALAGLVHLVALVRAVWTRDRVAAGLVALTLAGWVLAAHLAGVRLPNLA